MRISQGFGYHLSINNLSFQALAAGRFPCGLTFNLSDLHYSLTIIFSPSMRVQN